MDRTTRLQKAKKCLDGLSVGDAFGELFFMRSSTLPDTLESLPQGPWPWTDDTHMALSIFESLKIDGRIIQDKLAQRFAARFLDEPFRGYGRGAVHLLTKIAQGESWRTVAPSLFGGGSFGNGSAMRVAPLGAFFATDLLRVVDEAAASAEVTHSHPEGKAGAIAVAVATAIALTCKDKKGVAFIQAVLPWLPDSETKSGIEKALEISPDDIAGAFCTLGTGANVSAQDTVPFCIWAAAYHLGDFEAALWHTAKGRGDVDTTCAIVGGIVAASVPEIPCQLLIRREAIPEL
jgi:ADP-ribosylglycohydrolase